MTQKQKAITATEQRNSEGRARSKTGGSRWRSPSVSAEATAARAQGNAPVAAKVAPERLSASSTGTAARRIRMLRAEAAFNEELKRQAAAEEHAAVRGGRIVRGPI